MYLLQANLCLSSACSSGTKEKEPGQQEARTRAGSEPLPGLKCRAVALCFQSRCSGQTQRHSFLLQEGDQGTRMGCFRCRGADLVATASGVWGASWGRGCGFVLEGSRRQNLGTSPREVGFASQDKLSNCQGSFAGSECSTWGGIQGQTDVCVSIV